MTGKALPGANLKATLSDDEDKSNKKSFTRVATTGRNGEAILTFPSLGEPGDSLSLTVEGTLAGEGGALVQDSVTGDVDVLDLGSLHTEMDKPLHKLGETFHVRGLAFRDGGHVAADEPVTVTVADPDNKTLVEAAVRTNRFGIVAYGWKTTEQTPTGDYEVRFNLDNVTGAGCDLTQQVRIQRYELPEFSVTATPDRAFYLAGEEPKVVIHAGYLFGKPVAAGSVRLVRATTRSGTRRQGATTSPRTLRTRHNSTQAARPRSR